MSAERQPSQEKMKVFIQHSATRRFLGTSGEWVTKDAAHDFGSGASAVASALAARLSDVVLYYAFSDARADFSLPISRPRPSI